MANKVAIEVEIKNIKRIADLKKELQSLRKAQKDQEKESKSGRFQSKESAKAYRERAKAVKENSKELRTLNKDMAGATKATKSATKANNGMAKQFIKGAAAIGIVVGAFRAVSRVVSSVVSVFTEFEFVMAKVNAVSGATESEFKGLTKTAEELGRTTFFTATQVGELMLNFSKLGFSANEIQNAVAPTLALATATGSDLARAAIVAGSAIRGFGLDADQTARVTDVMAVSFSRSAMDIEKWQTSMTKVAPIAKAAGFSIEDTAAIMSKLADSGIEASIAGTSLRNILLKMQDPTSDLSQAFGGTIHSLDELVPAMESFVSEGGDMADILQVVDLRQAAAFEQMLSNTDAMIDLRNEMNESSGEAERMAKIIGDTLQGSFLKFTSAMQGLSIAVMKDFVAGFQSAIDKVTSFTTFLTKNSETISSTIKALVKIAKWIGIYKLAVMSVIPIQTAFTSLVSAYRTVAISAKLATFTFAGALRTLKLAWQSLLGSTGIGLAVVVLTELAMSFFSATDAIEETTLATEDFIDAESRLKKVVDDTNTIMNQRYADTEKGAKDSIDKIDDEIKARRKLLAQANLNLGDFVSNIQLMSNEEQQAYRDSIKRLETRFKLESRNLTEIQKRDFLKAQQEKDLLFIQEKKLKVAQGLSVTNEEDLKAKNILINTIQKEINRLNNLGAAIDQNTKSLKENYDAEAEIIALLMNQGVRSKEEEARVMKHLNDERKKEITLQLKSLNQFVMNVDLRKKLLAELASLTSSTAKTEGEIDADAQKRKDDLFKSDVKRAIMSGQTAEEAMKTVVRAQIMEAVAGFIASIFKTMPFPVNLILAAGASAVVGGLIDGQLSKFRDGGVVDGDKFANGGMVHGASHAQGGVKFAVGGRVNELEGGEAVINKRSTAMFRNQLSSMNQAGGGVKFADGGLTSSPQFAEAQFNANNQSQMMGAMQGQRRVVVVEADITDSQSTVSVIQSNATF